MLSHLHIHPQSVGKLEGALGAPERKTDLRPPDPLSTRWYNPHTNMVFSTGTKLGVYEISGVLGAGGMGEVYRARDSNLDRDVAIKVLPEKFGRDPESVARFRREAKVLASLNHPNIANIHDLQEINSTQFLILEFVDGET